MSNILATRSVSTFNAMAINYSTLNTVSNTVYIGQSTSKTYTTLAQGNFSTATNWISTLNTMSTGKVVAMSANAQTQLVVTQLSTVSSLYYTSSLQTWSSTFSATSGLPVSTFYSAGAVSGTGQYQILGTNSGVVSTVGAGGGMTAFVSNNSGASFTSTLVNTPYIYLPFDNSTADVYGHTVTTTGTFTYGTGVIGSNSAFFNNSVGGTASYRVAVAWPGAPAFTIAGWFYATGFGSGTTPVIFHAYGGAAIIWINNNGTVYAGVPSGGGTNSIQLALSSAITVNTWYSFAYIFQSGGTCSFYLNNVLIGSVTNTGGIGTNTISSIFIGAGSGGNVAFAGYMDDFRIYNNAFTYPMNYSNVAVSNSGQYMLATVAGGGLFMSVNYGQAWTQVTSQLLTATWLSAAVSASGQYILAYVTPLTITPQLTGLASSTWQVNGVSWFVSASSTGQSPSYVMFDTLTNQYWTSAQTNLYNGSGVYVGTTSTYVNGQGSVTGEWLQIQSSVPIQMYSYTLNAGSYTQYPNGLTVAGSNDGSNWYLIQSVTMSGNPIGTAGAATSTSYIIVNQSGAQTMTTTGGSATFTCTTSAYSANAYTYFRLIFPASFGSAGYITLTEWLIRFNAGGQNYSTNYGSTWQNGYALTTPTLALSGNGQYALGANTTPSVYIINNYLQGFTANNNTLAVFSPVLTASSIVAAALSNTGQYMVLVTSNTTGANVYYSVNYGTSFLGMLIGSVAMAGCSISYDGSYITVTNGTTIYQLNNNSSGFSLAVGNNAGVQNQGQNAIAIGNQAGTTNQSANSIILNASGSALNSYTQGFYVAPIAPAASTALYNVLGYGTDNQIVQTCLSLGSTVSSQTIYGEWIQLQLATPVYITSYQLAGRVGYTAARYPITWTLVGSVDGNNWTILDSQSGQTGFGTYTLKVASAIYSYFRIILISTSSITDIGGFILFTNGTSVFGANANYTIAAGSLSYYNVLQLSGVTVCTTTFSWNNTGSANALGITGDGQAGSPGASYWSCALLPTTDGYSKAATGNPYYAGLQIASVGAAYEYSSSYVATQGTATVINSTNVYVPTGNVGIGITNPSSLLHLYSTSTSTLPFIMSGIGETYALSSSAKNTYYIAGTLAAWYNTYTATTTATLIDIGATPASNGSSNVYFGAVAGATGNGPANFVIGRRSGVTSWAESVRVDTTGNVGIGTNSPSQKLHVHQDGNSLNSEGANQHSMVIMSSQGTYAVNQMQMLLDADYTNQCCSIASIKSGIIWYNLSLNPRGGNVGIGITNPGYTLHVVGAIYASGDITALSDKRYKQDIVPLLDSLNRITQLTGYSYTRSDDNDKKHIGLIAQEVNEVFPEAVSYKNDSYSLNYGCLIAPVIQAMKELKERVDKQDLLIQQLTVLVHNNTASA